MKTRFRWFFFGCLTIMEIVILYFAFSNLDSPWNGVGVSLGLLTFSVDGFLLFQLPHFSFSEKQKRRMQKTQLMIGAFALIALPFETISARNKQAHRTAQTLEIARLQTEIKRLEAQNAQLDAREKSRRNLATILR